MRFRGSAQTGGGVYLFFVAMSALDGTTDTRVIATSSFTSLVLSQLGGWSGLVYSLLETVMTALV